MEDVVFCEPSVWQEGELFEMSRWGLRWVEPYHISYPEPKVGQADIPGCNGVFENIPGRRSELLKPCYGNRTMELTFVSADKDYRDFERKKQILSTNLHGRRRGVILTIDNNYLYVGRFKLDFQKSSKIESTLTLTGDIEPYKYRRWEKYKQIVLTDLTVTREVKFPELGFDQIPEIQLVHGDVYARSTTDDKYEQELSKDERIYPDIWLPASGGSLYFRGNGVVRVYAREGAL